jgi:hypothetical protein
MESRRVLTLFAIILGTAALLQAQQPKTEHAQNSQPTSKNHRIGESAQQFFSIARMAEKDGTLSTEYCRVYLNDPKVKKAVEKNKRKAGEDVAMSVATMDVEGCNTIRAALAGQDFEIELRYAAESGAGARFVDGKLASVNFAVKAPFDQVVEDMAGKLNAPPQLAVDTIQNAVGAMVSQRKAIWTLPNMLVRLSEIQSLEGENVGTLVSVYDPEMMKHRANSLN